MYRLKQDSSVSLPQRIATERHNCYHTLVAVGYKKLWREERVSCEPIASACSSATGACFAPLCKYATNVLQPLCWGLGSPPLLYPGSGCLDNTNLLSVFLLCNPGWPQDSSNPVLECWANKQPAHLSVGFPFWASRLTLSPHCWLSFHPLGCPPQPDFLLAINAY